MCPLLNLLVSNWSWDWWRQQFIWVKFFTSKTGHILCCWRGNYMLINICRRANGFWAAALQISSGDVIFLMTNSVNSRYIICYKSLERSFNSDLLFLGKYPFKMKNLKDLDLQMWCTQVISFHWSVYWLQEFRTWK